VISSLAATALGSFFAGAAGEFDAAAERLGLTEHRLRFGSCTVRLRFAGSELAAVLLPAFGDRGGGASADFGATIDLWEERSCAGGSAPFPWAFAEIGPGGLVRGDGSQRVLAVHETASRSLTLVDLDRRKLLHRVPDAAAVRWWERAAPLRSALYWALGGRHRHLVHAGAVGDQRGCALLAGASGSGKTTAALAALAHGLLYIADDYVLLDIADEATACSIYGTAKLDDGHLERFPTLASKVRHPPAADAGQKAVLDVARLMPDSTRESLPVRAVIVPRICGGRSRLRRIKAGAAMLALAPSTVLQQPFGEGEVVGALAEVVRRVPCFALDVGDDVADLPALVQEALAA
jgi:hypothetical protein